MKKVRIKNIKKPVRCSFCKTEKTEYRWQGHPYYGRSICNKCYIEFEAKEIAKSKRDFESEGERQTFSMYGI